MIEIWCKKKVRISKCLLNYLFSLFIYCLKGRQTIEIAQVYLHPQYDQPSSPEKSFDISLLKLKEPAQFSDYVSPPCLPDQDDFGDESSFGVGMECYLSGLNIIFTIYLQILLMLAILEITF